MLVVLPSVEDANVLLDAWETEVSTEDSEDADFSRDGRNEDRNAGGLL